MRRGRQTPTFEVVGSFDRSDGPDAVRLFEGYGVRFIPAQAYEMDLYLAKNEIGESEAITIGLSRPRQNGKSFAARYYSLWCAFIEGKSVLYSAHNGSTTRKMFKFMCDFIDLNADFKKKLKPNGQGVYKAQGSEGIYLADGTIIEFSTRTNSGARGGTYDVIVVDEAQELTDEQRDAMLPTTIASESGDPQIIYIGTPPNPKCPGTVFRDLHNRAHSGDLGGAWWLEWAADEIGDPKDEDRWYDCNPMMGYRIKERSMRNAADTTAPDSFAREYLGWWSPRTNSVERVIDAAEWDACRTDDPPSDGDMCIAVKFSPDGRSGAVAICVKRGDGMPAYIEADARPTSGGVGWFADFAVKRKAKTAEVWIDGRSGSEALYRELAARGFPKRAIRIASPSDMANATALLVDAVRSHSVEHYGQDALTRSATLSAKRRIGADGIGFGDTAEADASLIEACALAYRATKTTKRKPGRKAVVL